MIIKDAITSGAAINDDLMSSIACELCINDSNNDDTMPNSKHVKSFIELAALASKNHMMSMHFTTGNLNTKTNANIPMSLHIAKHYVE